MTRTQLWRARRKAGCPRLCPIQWTPEMDAKLREMRAQGIGFDRCGAAIGVNKGTVARRVAALALPKVAQYRRRAA